ncbi:hypothetical protein SISNIDRAFT_494389 [Sistotremastrum niveocremeum HHB9708]|uniref:Uncharacterized protein n=1 Tax=Sistotremastrum niveocremeum HHB9708 TaxID=1314777 RepID=A0A164WYY0_9AGAM|nr:hypothetical protein SISNIDRAFT_494389 [Sistotremastrum niveocremeum HHB9708]
MTAVCRSGSERADHSLSGFPARNIYLELRIMETCPFGVMMEIPFHKAEDRRFRLQYETYGVEHTIGTRDSNLRKLPPPPIPKCSDVWIYALASFHAQIGKQPVIVFYFPGANKWVLCPSRNIRRSQRSPHFRFQDNHTDPRSTGDEDVLRKPLKRSPRNAYPNDGNMIRVKLSKRARKSCLVIEERKSRQGRPDNQRNIMVVQEYLDLKKKTRQSMAHVDYLTEQKALHRILA